MIEKLGITPGPWESTGYHVQTKEKRQDYAKHICSAPGDYDATKADFTLIAAAPEMLEALIKEALQAESEWGRAQMETEEAIEKATGRTWREVKEIIKDK